MTESEDLEERRRFLADKRSKRCEHCNLYPKECICEQLPRLGFPIDLVLLQQSRERKSQSNTGNLVHRVIENSKILVHGSRDEKLDASELSRDDTEHLLLFPSDGKVLSPDALPTDGRRAQLIVLDASWRQARRMFRRIGDLRGAKSYALPAHARPKSFLRVPKYESQLNTCEAVAWAARCLEAPQVADALEGALELLVPRILASRGRRGNTLSRIQKRGWEGRDGEALLADEE